MSGNLFKSLATVSGLTMVSRVMGFARQVLVAGVIGAGGNPVADAFWAAFRLPNMFRRLFAEGAFHAAFIPLFQGAQIDGGKEEAKRFAEETLAGLVFVLTLLTALVDLRRKNATEALSASTPKLMEMATAFVANLKAMQGQSVEACYGFISKGEATPEAATMLTKPDQAQPLQKQLEAVFAAAAEGRVSPMTRQAPQKKDYDLLAAELGTIGWSEADMQLFADPKALAQAPKDQVCKMVQDWFAAQLTVPDEQSQARLLGEALKQKNS
mgnify:CR=1 FL=1